MREYSLMYIVQYALDEEWNMRATAHWMRTDNAEWSVLTPYTRYVMQGTG